MSETGETQAQETQQDTQETQEEVQLEIPEDPTRREFLKAIVATALAITMYGTENPTEEQITQCYRKLAEKKASELHEFVDPVNFPIGNWSMSQKEEHPVSVVKDNSLEINPSAIAEKTGKATTFTGKYTFSNKEKDQKIVFHLGLHGQYSKSITNLPPNLTIQVEDTDNIGGVSFDSLHSLSSWIEMDNPTSNNLPVSIDLAKIPKEIIDSINDSIAHFTGKWVLNLPEETLLLATDLAMNETVAWANFFQYATNPSSSGFYKALLQSKTITELMSLSGVALAVKNLFNNELEEKTTRREFLKKIIRGFTIGGASVLLTKSAIDLFSENKKVIRNIENSHINDRVNQQVKERVPEHFMGRLEGLLKQEAKDVSLHEVFFMLRDITSTYKELVIAESKFFGEEKNLMSAWGAYHDTKIGFYQAEKNYLLEKIDSFYKNFQEKVDLCFVIDETLVSWMPKIKKSSLWTAMTYKTNSTIDGRKISEAHLWQFPELRRIFFK